MVPSKFNKYPVSVFYKYKTQHVYLVPINYKNLVSKNSKLVI